MYIRRKVFSILEDENGEERYFSTTDITMENEEEKLFSVIELEQREFGNKENKAKTRKWRMQQGKEILEKERGAKFQGVLAEKTRRAIDSDFYNTNTGNLDVDFKNIDKNSNIKSQQNKLLETARDRSYEGDSRFRRVQQRQQRGVKKIRGAKVEPEYNPLRDKGTRIRQLSPQHQEQLFRNREARRLAAEGAAKKATENTTKTTIQQATKTAAKETAEEVVKKGSRLGKGGKIALGLTGAAALGYGVKKAYDHYKNKNKK